MKACGDLHDSSYLPKTTVVIDVDVFTWFLFFPLTLLNLDFFPFVGLEGRRGDSSIHSIVVKLTWFVKHLILFALVISSCQS